MLIPYLMHFIYLKAIRFFGGLSHSTFFTSMLMLMLEYVSIEKRSLVGNLVRMRHPEQQPSTVFF